ncbi:MAG: EFR1 family ferrodoxin [Bacillota bacterium]|nr:EFR1 family ferrodoxin [Bacillota bacterium]
MTKPATLIYFSATDTTQKIVRAIGSGIASEYVEYNITLPKVREKVLSFDSDDLVVFAIPVYAGRLPSFLTTFLKKIRGNHTKAVFVVVYGNRNYDDALLELKDSLEDNGFIGLATGAFIGEHSYTNQVGTGRPDKDDLNVAYEFGRVIKEKLISEPIGQETKLHVKGQFPYKEITLVEPIAPVTNEECTQCKICASHCPVAAIDFNDCHKVDSSICVRCCSCIRKCPVNAKSMDHPFILQLTERLIINCGTVRHEPELFL